jgi:hypothetical protein
MSSTKNPGRSRIVIDLDQQTNVKPNQSKGRSWRYIGIVLSIITIAITITIYYWWQNYKTTPTYSLALLINAAQENDMNTFDKYFDANKVVLNSGSKMMDNIGLGGFPLLTEILSRGVGSDGPKLPPNVTNIIRDKAAQQIKEYAGEYSSKSIILTALSISYMSNDIKQEGDRTTITMKRWGQPTNIQMQRYNSHWIVVAIENEEMNNRILNSLKEVTLPVNRPKKKG